MSNPDIRLPWSLEEHPPVELLRQYQAGALSPAVDHQVERHLLSCDLCADVAEGMEVSTPAQTQAAVQDIHHRLVNRLAKEKRQTPVWVNWRAAAAVLVLLCSLGLVIYQQYKQQVHVNQPLATKSKDNSDVLASPPAIVPPIEALAEPEIQKETPVFKPSSPALVFQDKTPAVVTEDVVIDQKEMADSEDGKMAAVPLPKSFPPLTQDSEDQTYIPVTIEKERRSKLAKTLVTPSDEGVKIPTALQGKVAGIAPAVPNQQVKGKVVAANGEALPGVTVQVRGTTQAVATDANGEFLLTVPSGRTSVVASFIGYEKKEVSLSGNKAPLEIQLKEDDKALSEVVVVGYGARNSKAVSRTETEVSLPVGGMAAYKKYLEKQLRYPATAQAAKVKGRVVVEFMVGENGRPQNIKVLKGLCPDCDSEAIRLVLEGPSWKPGKVTGKPVSQKIKVSVRFKPTKP